MFSLSRVNLPLRVLTASLALTASYVSVSANASAEVKVLQAYSAIGTRISYQNTPNRAHTNITGHEPKGLAIVEVVLSEESDVLVQFTSQVGNLSKSGCPCSVRASLAADNVEPVVVKRINLSGGTGEGANYVPDRQGLDGSFVFRLPAGHHTVSMAVQQVGGTAEIIQAFYTNVQAIVFPKLPVAVPAN